MIYFFILLHPSFQVTFHKLLLILRFNYTQYKFYSSGYQAEFSPRPLPVFLLSLSPEPASSPGLYLTSTGSYFFEFHKQSHDQYQASPLPSLVDRKQ